MLSVEEARALVTTSLSDADLADVIAREEAWLARRIGPLEGERTETFATADGDEVLKLQRPASSVDVEDDSGTLTDVALHGWSDVTRTDVARSWNGDVLVTYTPSDPDEVKRVLVTLVRLTTSESAFASQSAEGYSVSSSILDQRVARFTASRSLMRPRVPTTTRLRSTIPFGGKTLAPVAIAAVGS
jgi:hypothetical protein